VLHACAGLLPEGFEIKFFKGLEDLPHFNPDREHEPHSALDHWKKEIVCAEALLICSPEYAHGIPGTLKNALDWIVGTAELDKKRIGVINASPLPAEGPTYALDNLVEVLRTMSADVRPEFILKIGEIKSKFNSAGELINEKTKTELKNLLFELNSMKN
jgi:chromate reductase